VAGASADAENQSSNTNFMVTRLYSEEEDDLTDTMISPREQTLSERGAAAGKGWNNSNTRNKQAIY